MTQYPLYRRPGGLQGRSGLVRKISSPTVVRSPDRPGRSESLDRLSYPGTLPEDIRYIIPLSALKLLPALRLPQCVLLESLWAWERPDFSRNMSLYQKHKLCCLNMVVFWLTQILYITITGRIYVFYHLKHNMYINALIKYLLYQGYMFRS